MYTLPLGFPLPCHAALPFTCWCRTFFTTPLICSRTFQHAHFISHLYLYRCCATCHCSDYSCTSVVGPPAVRLLPLCPILVLVYAVAFTYTTLPAFLVLLVPTGTLIYSVYFVSRPSILCGTSHCCFVVPLPFPFPLPTPLQDTHSARPDFSHLPPRWTHTHTPLFSLHFLCACGHRVRRKGQVWTTQAGGWRMDTHLPAPTCSPSQPHPLLQASLCGTAPLFYSSQPAHTPLCPRPALTLPCPPPFPSRYLPHHTPGPLIAPQADCLPARPHLILLHTCVPHYPGGIFVLFTFYRAVAPYICNSCSFSCPTTTHPYLPLAHFLVWAFYLPAVYLPPGISISSTIAPPLFYHSVIIIVPPTPPAMHLPLTHPHTRPHCLIPPYLPLDGRGAPSFIGHALVD